MLIFSIISILTTIICLQAGFFVLLKNPIQKINRIFFINALLMAIWSLGYGISLLATTEQSALIGLKIASFGVAFLPVTIMAIVLEFIGQNYLQKIKLYIIFALILFSSAVFYIFYNSNPQTGLLHFSSIQDVLFGKGHSIINFICYIYFLFACIASIILLLFLKPHKEEYKLILQQRILIFSLSFIVVFYFVYGLIQHYIPGKITGNLSYIAGLAWLFASGSVIHKYKSVKSPQKVTTETVLREMKKFLVFVDKRFFATNINAYSLKLIEHKKEDIIETYFPDLFADRELVEFYLNKVYKGSNLSDMQLQIISNSGNHIPLLLSFSLIKDSYGDKIGIVVFGDDNRESILLNEEVNYRKEIEERLNKAKEELDNRVEERTKELIDSYKELQVKITDRMKVEEQIKSDITEKEILISEIINRVKSNMQMIIALIDTQTEKTLHKLSYTKFCELSQRVKSILLVHEHLYLSLSYSDVDFASIIRILTDELLLIHNRKDAITLNFNVSDVYLNIDFAIPLGIVLNELISNALVHGFSDDFIKKNPGKKLELGISYRYADGKYEVIIADNGTGIPEKALKDNTGIGLQLTNVLITEQINGQYNIESKAGKTRISINFEDSN